MQRMIAVIRHIFFERHNHYMDPLAGSTWSAPGTVAGFAGSAPNATLMRFSAARLRQPGMRALDIGCGAGRNLLPLAEQGWDVIGVDLSGPMLEAAAERGRTSVARSRIRLALARMEALPVPSRSVDLIVAHGIWNLARSADQFRRAVREAARAARPGASLFVFTFSRRTLPDAARPVAGEPFVFTQFSGQPQCFLTAAQLAEDLASAGFVADDGVPLTEHNVPRPGAPRTGGPPVIFEAAYRYTGGAR